MSADPTDIHSKNQQQDSVSYIYYVFNVISGMFLLTLWFDYLRRLIDS